jgi:hypothetical protein
MALYVCIVLLLLSSSSASVKGQGLDPPGRLGVSPADAEKCDGYKRSDFDALLRAANKLSVAKHVLDQRVLPAAQEPTANDSQECAIGSTWDQLELQLHAAFSSPTYTTDDRALNPLQASFFPTVRDQVRQAGLKRGKTPAVTKC